MLRGGGATLRGNILGCQVLLRWRPRYLPPSEALMISCMPHSAGAVASSDASLRDIRKFSAARAAKPEVVHAPIDAVDLNALAKLRAKEFKTLPPNVVSRALAQLGLIQSGKPVEKRERLRAKLAVIVEVPELSPREALEAQTASRLKERCKELALVISGNKAALVDRLVAWEANHALAEPAGKKEAVSACGGEIETAELHPAKELNEQQLYAMTSRELKQLASANDVVTTGSKAEIIDRLLRHSAKHLRWKREGDNTGFELTKDDLDVLIVDAGSDSSADIGRAIQQLVMRLLAISAQLPAIKDDLARVKLLEDALVPVNQYTKAIANVLAMTNEQRMLERKHEESRRLLERFDRKLLSRKVGEAVRREIASVLARSAGAPELLHAHLEQAIYQHARNDPGSEAANQVFNTVPLSDSLMILSEIPPLPNEKGTIGVDAGLATLALEGRALEVHVGLDHADGSTDALLGHAPAASRSILLSSLPMDVTEEDIIETLAPCGAVKSVELCMEWQTEKDLCAASRLNIREQVELKRRFRESYAIVEFETEEAFLAATSRPVRLFGILMRESVAKGTSTTMKSMDVGRATYPQAVQGKRSLLLRGFSWSTEPRDLLKECAIRLATGLPEQMNNAVIRLRAVNPALFADTQGFQLKSLEVQAPGSLSSSSSSFSSLADGVDVRETARDKELLSTSVHLSIVVLRFHSFAQAYWARKQLQGLVLGGLEASCGFAPQRAKVCEVDAKGNPLDEPVLLDMPLPPNSAYYEHGVDPVVLFGVRV